MSQLTVQRRNESVCKSTSNLDKCFVERNDLQQSQELKHDITRLAQIGIWDLINNSDKVASISNGNLIFTGQQPTIDWGLHRRAGKSLVDYENAIVIHTHADHDKAGKGGFGSLTIPFVDDQGRVVPKVFTLIEQNGSELMADVPVPDKEKIKKFFDEIIKTFDQTLSNLKQQGLVISELFSTEILGQCKDFILENYNLIRSGAELNAAIQAKLIQLMDPSSTRIDIMLSDLFETDSFKTSLSELIIEMPSWIDAYNISAEYINQTQYNTHKLPKPEDVIEYQGDVYKSTPLWVNLASDNSKTKKRNKVWMKTDQGNEQISFGYQGKNREYIELFSFKGTDNQAQSNVRGYLEKYSITPGAVALVDILRNRLHLPAVHGKTGYYYEAINELTSALLSGQITQEDLLSFHGNVLDPDFVQGMAPIGTVHFDSRRRGPILRAQKFEELSLEEVHEISNKLNKRRGELFQILPRFPVNNSKENILDQYNLSETDQRLLLENLGLQDLSQVKVRDFFDSIAQCIYQKGDRGFIQNLNGFSEVLEKNMGWIEAKLEIFEINTKQAEIRERLLDKTNVNDRQKAIYEDIPDDISIIEAAVFGKHRLRAIQRLLRMKKNLQVVEM